MNLEIKDKNFIVTGATSGIGREIASCLLQEGAKLIINARNAEKLKGFKAEYPDQIETLVGDIMTDVTLSNLMRLISGKVIDGIVINASGPPPKSFNATIIDDWDDAYEGLLRWKIKLTRAILPYFEKQAYGRFVFIESASVKQPIDNLILSNSLRLAVLVLLKAFQERSPIKG